jgi:hypothetical protein
MLSIFLVSGDSLAAGSFGACPAAVAKDRLGIGRALGTARPFT